MPVLSVKLLDRNRNIQQMPQTEDTCRYPLVSSSCTREIQGPSLIKRWVGVIKKLAGEE
ncbi:MAG: hypothetical protein GX085_01750 [Firmicutes bacterium]|nr:hypothetical protein [Bacillota bacterium]